MRRISKINRIEQMQNDLRHSEEKSKQRKSNSKDFETILKEEEKNLEEKKIEKEKQTKQNALDIYKVEIQKQKPFRNIVNKTVEKSEENEHDEK